MILIIAEKPSLGRNIASALGQFRRRDGYLENEQYLVTWAFGHLFSLADIEAYRPSPSGRWSMENIPCFPETFRYELRRGKDKQADSGVVKQFKIIESLCNRADVDTIVNAGDADREGEIIVRTCIEKALKSPKSRSVAVVFSITGILMFLPERIACTRSPTTADAVAPAPAPGP